MRVGGQTPPSIPGGHSPVRDRRRSVSRATGRRPRQAFVKNDELSFPGFMRRADADRVAGSVPRIVGRRVRVAYRSRTGTYDVVVRDLREVES